jgi:hypothetical protein
VFDLVDESTQKLDEKRKKKKRDLKLFSFFNTVKRLCPVYSITVVHLLNKKKENK